MNPDGPEAWFLLKSGLHIRWSDIRRTRVRQSLHVVLAYAGAVPGTAACQVRLAANDDKMQDELRKLFC